MLAGSPRGSGDVTAAQHAEHETHRAGARAAAVQAGGGGGRDRDDRASPAQHRCRQSVRTHPLMTLRTRSLLKSQSHLRDPARRLLTIP